MSFTTLATVKKHLLQSGFAALHIEDHDLTLTGTDPVALPHHNLIEASEVVKRPEETVPGLSGVLTLTGTDWVEIGEVNLIPESIVVTLSESFGTLHNEELDFQIDYDQGRIRRTNDSAIADSTGVIVYYSKYRIFVISDDYSIDYAAGTIERRSNGAIPDGGRVKLDYDVAAGTAQDDLILEAIVEAEDMIARNLAPGYTISSSDQGLNSGATWLTLAIVCRALAAETLSRVSGSEAGARGRELQNLSERYEHKAWNVLQPFINPVALRSPVKFVNE